MGEFSNPVVGGVGKLIRQFVQSPNFVSGSSGWTINKDGSAEFQNATIRGSVIIGGSGNAVLFYSPSPGAGNLFLSIAPSNGTDAYGNTYTGGIEFHSAPAGTGLHFDGINNPAQEMRLFMDSSGGVDTLKLSGPMGVQFDLGQSVLLGSADTVIIGTAISGKFQVGNGIPGRYYDEEYKGFLPNLANGALTTIDPTTGAHKIHNDYGASAWTGNTWTAPDDGEYTLQSFFPNVFDGDWANVHRHLIDGAIIDSLGVNNGAVHSPGIASLSSTIELASGDTFQMAALQNSGAARAMTAQSRIHIRRSI
jgi:hypothetical protein